MIDSVVALGLALIGTLVCYALLGGADYGGGVWDLCATGASADRQRATIARAIGPVWEANHVWLIVAVVILFNGFPLAFSTISTFLHIPLLLILVGIVLRGSAFVFRAYGPDDRRYQLWWGRVFAGASIVTPLFLGVVVGAITEGHMSNGQGSFTDAFIRPWFTPFAFAVGFFALGLFAFLAAVYLTLEATEDDVRRAFRTRALASGVAVGALALFVLLVASPDVRRELIASSWSVPLHAATGISAIVVFASLVREQYALARIAAAAQVTFILLGWALVQFPFAIRPHLTLADAAAPANVRILLLQILGVGALLLIPSLLYLFRIFGPRGRPIHTSRRPSD